MTNWQNKHNGGCRCGAVRYEIDLTETNTLACHCTDCQKHLGSPFSVFTVVPASRFRWLAEPKGSIAFSNDATRLFCNKCGTYIRWEGRSATDEAEINAMTLDDPSCIVIDEEIYTRSRMSWVEPIESAKQYVAGRNS